MVQVQVKLLNYVHEDKARADAVLVAVDHGNVDVLGAVALRSEALIRVSQEGYRVVQVVFRDEFLVAQGHAAHYRVHVGRFVAEHKVDARVIAPSA